MSILCTKHGAAMMTPAGCLLCATEALEAEGVVVEAFSTCPVCGWQGPIGAGHFCEPKCQHVAPLAIPDLVEVPEKIGALRQCRDCKLIGFRLRSGQTLWMSPPDPETKG